MSFFSLLIFLGVGISLGLWVLGLIFRPVIRDFKIVDVEERYCRFVTWSSSDDYEDFLVKLNQVSSRQVTSYTFYKPDGFRLRMAVFNQQQYPYFCKLAKAGLVSRLCS